MEGSTLTVIPLILLRWPIMSEVDVRDIGVEHESPVNNP